ncbi:hypothetical protein RB623_17570 [Mesorhizobium sp. LHD-90]|uniref:hypothetical protein n=1 Tax=Mesorhizobium sp. LHD-90 TaxID=3071414 RepID=UPI0027E16AF0|nr:hypothetical protein [Mesorhizobium sp. LHD-90]MDQ6435869.1 hypothetical protein [Mesorhizobium sp. LHD-90]
MDRAERENEQETLKGMAAVLLKLAVLAEFLCVLPLWIRVPVLTLLRPAEAVARAFAAERAGGALALPPAAVGDADGCAEALHLARCFRALAFVFGGLQDLFAGRRLFRNWLNGRLAHRTPAMAWRDHAKRARRAMVCGVAGRIDTS